MRSLSNTGHLLLSALAAAVIVLVPLARADAAELTPVGLWKTIDDKTGTERSIVRIWEEGGKLQGKIVKAFPRPGEDPNRKCDKCPGDKKDQPIIGLTFLWDLSHDGDEWSGGKIMDPDNGKIYKAYIAVQDNGAKLKVRGFIGFALIGRTQIWHRVDESALQ